MIKRIQWQAALAVAFLFFSCARAQQENSKVSHEQPDTELGGLFESGDGDFETLNIHMPLLRTKKVSIAIKDLPFYIKIFCSYVYEEKIKKWYQAAFGYVSVTKK